MSIPVLLALAAPGLGLDRAKANRVLGLIDAADAGARFAAHILEEDVRSPFQTQETLPENVGQLQPQDQLPTDEERRNCPGNVFPLVVLGPEASALDEVAALFRSNELQTGFLHMVNDNVK